MIKKLYWYDLITINIFWLGLNVSNGTITPLLLPYLVALFVPATMKNSGLATVRAIGLTAAMLVQPTAGLFSDRNTSRWGRRRPYIFAGVFFNLMFLFIIGLSPSLFGSQVDLFLQNLSLYNTGYIVLVLGFVLLQISSNTTQGATQGLIPDLVPEDQRGRASGVKAVMELLPIFLVILISPLVDAGEIWAVLGIVGGVFLITMLVTLLFVHEKPLIAKPPGGIKGPFLRLVALTAIFVGTTQIAIMVVKFSGEQLNKLQANINLQIILLGFIGLVGMAGSIFIGVYLGAWVGIGQQSHQHKSFLWWVVNRLLFLAAVGSIQGFALYFLSDVLHIPDAATQTTFLLGAVALFLLPAAVVGGYIADRIGCKRMVALSGLIAMCGSFLLLFANGMPLVIVSGCIIGLGTGIFMATNWALGTDLAPKEQAGKFLGISNLAGAGAGIVGAGIGGPMADFFNTLQPGLGYMVIITLYGLLFLFSTLALTRVTETR